MKVIAQSNAQMTNELETILAGLMKPELIQEVALNIGLSALRTMTVVELGTMMQKFTIREPKETPVEIPRTRIRRTKAEITPIPVPEIEPSFASDGSALPSAPRIP